MKNRFYSRHTLMSLLILSCFVHFSFLQKGIQTPDFQGKEVKNVAGQSEELYLQDSVFLPGQLLGLNAVSPWIGGVFNVSSDLSTVTNDSTFVVPPIQLPAPSTGGYYDTTDYFAIDYNPADGLYYLLADNSAGGLNLYSVDLTTAATIDLGLISYDNSYAGGIIFSMTFDNSGNLYFALLDDFFDPPFYTVVRVIPAEMLTYPVPAPTSVGLIQIESGGCMSYNFDDNTIYFATGSRLYELSLSGGTINGPISYTAPDECEGGGGAIEYVGNGILYGSSCNQIYQIDPATGASDSLATYSGNFSDLLFVPPISSSIKSTEFEADFIVDVFPNPTNDELTILFETVHSDDINFKLTDVLGRTIMEENITPNIGLNTKIIDLSELASAVYFVIVDDGKAVRKVVRK